MNFFNRIKLKYKAMVETLTDTNTVILEAKIAQLEAEKSALQAQLKSKEYELENKQRDVTRYYQDLNIANIEKEDLRRWQMTALEIMKDAGIKLD